MIYDIFHVALHGYYSTGVVDQTSSQDAVAKVCWQEFRAFLRGCEGVCVWAWNDVWQCLVPRQSPLLIYLPNRHALG